MSTPILSEFVGKVVPVYDLPTGRGLLAAEDLPKGAIVASFVDADIVDEMSIYSVQVGHDEHIRHDALDLLNHSCEPNVFLDVTRKVVQTNRVVRRGEELTFFYPATEWAMLRPFPCFCRSKNCIGLVSGARDLPAKVLGRYHLTPHVAELHELQPA